MNRHLVSVVIPAYNQASLLPDTIRSVLAQTYSNFEIIVVDDASSDNTAATVAQFDDPRIRYIAHKSNLRLPTARNTGVRAATGDFIAFLDADDLYRPDKLRAHVDFLEGCPDVDVTYNARFELDHSATTIREIWWPPPTVELQDLILGFPFAPSDMVTKRGRLLEVGLFNPDMGSAEDTDLPCRLALAGARFACVDRVLNDRRYHSGRGRSNLRGRRDDVARALEAVFADPRCPPQVQAGRTTARTHHLMVLVSLALMQNEIGLAHEFVDELVRTNPDTVRGVPCELVSFLMMEAVADNGIDHEELLRQMFARLPSSLVELSGQYEWAIGRGYLWKGLRAALWDRPEEARPFLIQAARHNAEIDEPFLQFLTSHLQNHERAFGLDSALVALERIGNGLQELGSGHNAKRLRGAFHLSRAFRQFHAGGTKDLLRTVLRAVANDPSYLGNRGVMSMVVRSMMAVVARQA